MTRILAAAAAAAAAAAFALDPAALAPLPAACAQTAAGRSQQPGAPGARLPILTGQHALTLFAAGRWDEAYAEFHDAETLAHSPVFVLYMARCRRNAGRLIEAQPLFDRAAAEPVVQTSPLPWRRAAADAAAEREGSRRRIPRILITIAGAPSEAPVDLRIDDGERRGVDLRQPIELDPGRHHILVRDAQKREATETIDLAEGEPQRTLRLSFAPVASPPVRGGDADASPPRWRKLGFGLLALGVVGLGTGIVGGVVASNKASAIRPGCIDGHCLASEAGAGRSAATWATVSTTGFIAGALSAATGVLLVIMTPARGADAGASDAPGPRLSLEILPGDSSIAASIAGVF